MVVRGASDLPAPGLGRTAGLAVCVAIRLVAGGAGMQVPSNGAHHSTAVSNEPGGALARQKVRFP
jgi:hypothetical protein